MIYLDHAAATPLDAAVLAAMQPYFADKFYNPSALYSPAQAVAHDIAAARRQVAAILGARPTEIIFTAGGTEANNIAIHGIMQRYPNAEIVVSAIEHDSVLLPAQIYNCQVAPVDEHGFADVLAAVTDNTVLISLMYANNEIGTVQSLRSLTQAVAKIRADRKAAGNDLPLYVHSDACQAGNYLDLHVNRLGVDVLTLNGGKIYGPKQSGVLFVKAGLELKPLVYGGGQEYGLRSGTENVPAIIGFAAALQKAQAMRAEEVLRLQNLQQHFIDELKTAVPSALLNGSLKKRLPNNIHVTFPGHDNERLLLKLDAAGIIAAAGSACSASNEEPSHVLRAIGLSEAGAQASLRFSLGRSTTLADVAETLRVLAAIL